MVESGITIGGTLSLEEYLIGKEKKRFYKSVNDDIDEMKRIFYHNHKTKCEQKYNTKPSRVKYIVKGGEYMDQDYEGPSSGIELFMVRLTMKHANDSRWWTLREMLDVTGDLKVGARALAQAASRALERWSSIIRKRSRGRENEYSFIQAMQNATPLDVLKLCRKAWTLEEYAQHIPQLRAFLANEKGIKSNVTLSLEQVGTEICKIRQELEIIRGYLKLDDQSNVENLRRAGITIIVNKQ